MESQNLMGLTGRFFHFVGVVECILDPEKLGRVRVRVLGEHTQDKVEIPTDHLPWAMVVMPVTSASISGVGESPLGLMVGSWVVGFYLDGENKQQPCILGSLGGFPLDPPFGDVGFNDFTECFPQEDKLEEPDTNRLARGIVGEHVIDHVAVTVRKESVMNNIATAADQWSEPETPYAAIYPYNYVWEGPYNPKCDGCEWGHLEEWDSTPGAERYFRQHKTSQNFLEIHPDGKEVRKIYGDGFEIDLGSKHLYIEGDYRVTVMGNKDEYIKGDYWQHIEGDYIRVVEGDKICMTEGKDALTSQDEIIQRAKGNIFVASEQNLINQANIDINILSGSKVKISSVEESTIGIGSYSPITVEPIPPVSVNSDSFPSVTLKCDEMNQEKDSISNTIIPEIPAFSLEASSTFETQVKVIPDKIYIDAKDIHELGETYFKEDVHFNKNIFVFNTANVNDDVKIDGELHVGMDAYIGNFLEVVEEIWGIVVETPGMPPEEADVPTKAEETEKATITETSEIPDKTYSPNNKSTTPVEPDDYFECEESE